ncbi:hypothetical protein NKR19_g4536 [Coniochaeta hoffmannii]|uniref:Uncharacterized protein n=1 Tax=Coniochaeta hoffmannii TaxID=91930 RepID=A0AA38VUU2_9PEZI|nr:hypothetical protein NKR19_g4536 [Coniochaeta hoffmannii]
MSEPSQTSDTPQASGNAQAEPLSHPTEVPQSFPQKRRGRPPGRPNTTVKESDYENNPSVQRWNASKIDTAIPAVAINIREALPESFLTRDPQRAIFRLSSREFIYFVQGWITSRQIASQRPSYVNGLLIHSRGEDSPVSCDQCADKRGKNALGPFLTCRVLPGNFHNSCSNCKWFDTTSACSLYTGPKPNRKRKAKGSRGEGEGAEKDARDLAPDAMSAALLRVEGQDEVSAHLTSVERTANDTELTVLALPQQDVGRPVTQENASSIPSGIDAETR